jgi:modulator of FtsH protease HflK
VLRNSRKVIIDSKSGNGNMLYLPLDKLLDRRTDSDSNSITVRPPISVESDPASNVDPRQRVER